MTDSVSNQEELGPEDGVAPEGDDAMEGAGVEAPEAVDGKDGAADGPAAAEDAEAAGRAERETSDDPMEAGTDEAREDDAVMDVDLGLDADAALDALREDYDGLNDRHLRLVAEFNNFRRRTDQERIDLWGRAQADLVGRLVDVLDDLQRVAALDLSNATVEGIMEGIDLVERKFSRTLDDAGAEVIDPEGEPFDPERMEAMMRVPAESEEDDDTVAQVFQKGYTFKGHLVRAARVSVLKHG
jgi:molecular chaperone GrpE